MIGNSNRRYKDNDSPVVKDAIFTKHHADLSDQIKVLQKALANSRGDNLLSITTLSNKLDKILEKVGILESQNNYLSCNKKYHLQSQSLGDNNVCDDLHRTPYFN
ncbi:hypothetical protein BH18THE2_BH18THE2_27570 [soil metagenome]